MPLSLNKTNSHRILLLIIGLFIVAFGIVIFKVPPGLDPDPSWGFLVMHCMELGGKFNVISSPDPTNIAINHSEFLAWWSPGQYLAPYFFKNLFNVDTGRAVALTIAICNLVGITGFYKLFTKLGFSKWIAAISIAFICCQLYFVSSFSYYTGGEVLLYGFMGWFLYGCFSFKKINLPVLLFVFICGLVGFFTKSSMLWIYATGIACLWINVSMGETTALRFNKVTLLQWLKNGVLLAVPFACAIAIIYIFYLSKGANPTSDAGALLVKPETLGFPLASPLLSALSIDEIFDGLLYQPDGANISYPIAVLLISVFALCCIAFVVLLKRFSPDRKYTIGVTTFYILGTLFFSYMYLKQATISYEGRHFRILGLLFMPGIVYLASKTKITTVLFFGVWAVYTYLSFSFARMEFNENTNVARGASNLSQQMYDKPTVDELTRLDKAHHNDAIFVVTNPDIAIEVQHNRVIIIDEETPLSEYAKLRFAGKAGSIYIITPTSYVPTGKQANLIKSFVNYQHFQTKQLSAKSNIAFADN